MVVSPFAVALAVIVALVGSGESETTRAELVIRAGLAGAIPVILAAAVTGAAAFAETIVRGRRAGAFGAAVAASLVGVASVAWLGYALDLLESVDPRRSAMAVLDALSAPRSAASIGRWVGLAVGFGIPFGAHARARGSVAGRTTDQGPASATTHRLLEAVAGLLFATIVTSCAIVLVVPADSDRLLLPLGNAALVATGSSFAAGLAVVPALIGGEAIAGGLARRLGSARSRETVAAAGDRPARGGSVRLRSFRAAC